MAAARPGSRYSDGLYRKRPRPGPNRQVVPRQRFQSACRAHPVTLGGWIRRTPLRRPGHAAAHCGVRAAAPNLATTPLRRTVLTMSELHLRRGIRFAAGVFLIAAGMQAMAHYQFYVADTLIDERRHAVIEAMKSYVLVPRLGTTMWTLHCMFSLSFAVLLLLAGTAYWWMAKDMPAQKLRPLATASAWLCFAATLLMAVAYPVLHTVLILLLAGLGFSAAAWGGRASRYR